MENKYKTRDFYEAAYLVAKECKILKIDRVLDSPRCYFVFDNPTRCKELVTEFWNKQGFIDGKTYAEAINYLKDRLFAKV